MAVALADTASVDSADLVYEMTTEGGGSRLLAVFQSQHPESVAAVGPTRAGDRETLKVLSPVVVFRGGAHRSVLLLQKSGLKTVNALSESGPFSPADGGLAVSIPQVVSGFATGVAAAQPVLSYAPVGEPMTAKGSSKVRTLSIAVPGGSTQVWRWNATTSTWRRTSGPAATATSVVVQVVPFDSQVISKGSSAILIPRVIGTGRYTLVSGGSGVSGTWYKKSAERVTNYAASDKSPVRLQPGRARILLVPPGTSIRTAAS